MLQQEEWGVNANVWLFTRSPSLETRTGTKDTNSQGAGGKKEILGPEQRWEEADDEQMEWGGERRRRGGECALRCLYLLAEKLQKLHKTRNDLYYSHTGGKCVYIYSKMKKRKLFG